MAVTVLKNISQDELNWYHESRYWMHVSDERSRLSSAFEEGMEKKAEEDALAFLNEKVPPETIAKCVKLPLEKVLELQKTIDSKPE